MISWRLTSQETFFSIAIMGKQFFLIAICFFPLINRCVNTLNPSLLGLFYSIFLFWSLITWTFDRGMICIGLKRFQKALELLYNVVTAPMHQVNAIALEAYKKYILVSLIHNGQFTNTLPKCASTAAQRSFKNYTGVSLNPIISCIFHV
jgi:hypothetical protein